MWSTRRRFRPRSTIFFGPTRARPPATRVIAAHANPEDRPIATVRTSAFPAKPRSKWAKRARLVGAALLAGLSAVGCSPAGLLDTGSRLAPGGDSARKVGDGIAYGVEPRQKLDVWAPRQATGAKLPVVVFFYGGGWDSGARGDYGFAGRAFAARGFVAVVADYRLVPQVRFPGFVEDAALAVKWARNEVGRYGGDPDRISVVGHSAGAHLAALVALDRHYLTDVGVDPGVIRSAVLLSGPFDFLPLKQQSAINALGNWPRLDETQPVHFARRDAPPILLISGTADHIVRARNSQALAAALRRVGAPVELKLYKGASHTDTLKALSPLFRGSNPALADSVAFLRAHDGPRR